jgi:hypothetical protein
MRANPEKLLLLSVFVALASMIICGCGQTARDSVSTSSRSALSSQVVAPRQFIKAAQTICRRGNNERGQRGNALLERRAKETGEGLGLVGEFEVVQKVVAPSLDKEVGQLERIGLPREMAYEAEALFETLRVVLHEVEAEGLYAWQSAKLLRPFRNRAKVFGLESCVLN